MRCKVFSLRPMIRDVLKNKCITSYFHVFVCLFLDIFVYLKGRMIGRDRKQSSIH